MVINIKKITNQLPIYFKQNKAIISTFLLLSLVLLIAGTYFIFFMGEDAHSTLLSGKIYIDGFSAPTGTNVSLIFPSETLFDPDGTNQTGLFKIDVTNYEDESFIVHVIYNDTRYVGTDESGNTIHMSVSEATNENITVFISTVESTENGKKDNSDKSDDNDTTGDEDNDKTNETEDNSGNNGNDEGSKGGEDGTDSNDNDEGGSSNDNGSDNSEEDEGSNNESDNDSSTDDEDQTVSEYLSVRKTVWNKNDKEWNQKINAEIGDTIQFNVTICYFGNDVSNIHVVDELPIGLKYGGNTSINGNNAESIFNCNDQLLKWNVSAVSTENTTFFIEYNTSVTQRKYLQNNVTARLIGNDALILKEESTASVDVYGDLIVSKTVYNESKSMWFNETTGKVGDQVQFNITLLYNGSHSLSNVSVIDTLSEGLSFDGNAMLNGDYINTSQSENNHTLVWNLSTSVWNELNVIKYNATIKEHNTLHNNVIITAEETSGKHFEKSASAMVHGKKVTVVDCEKMVRTDNCSWNHSVDVHTGSNATFKVVITPPENKTLSCLCVLDFLPAGLGYVKNSSFYIYQNQIIIKEPYYNESAHTLCWNESNHVIDSPLTICYKVTINDDGQLVNNVEFNSMVCTNYSSFDGGDSAIINATDPPMPLQVNILTPDFIYVDEYTEIQANVSGGNAPYHFRWDVDNDSNFEYENTSSIVMKWDEKGEYPLTLNVTDSDDDTCTKTVEIIVSIEPLLVDILNEQNMAIPGELIEFQGYATGGAGEYTWFWDFDDGTISNLRNPSHVFDSVGTFNVTLRVTDERNTTVEQVLFIEVSYPDTNGPVITFESPLNFMYIRKQALLPFFMPLAFGPVEINGSAEDNESVVESMELYINTQLVKSVQGNYLNYTWAEKAFGRKHIVIKAFDSEGNDNSKEIIIWKFF